MRIRMLSRVAAFKRYTNLVAGGVYDMPDEDALKLISAKQAERAAGLQEFMPEEPQKPEGGAEKGPPQEKEREAKVDPRYVSWFEANGFVRGPNGSAYSKTDRLPGGGIVKLVVDFKDNPGGNRYGMRLNEETGGWKGDDALRDHPILLEFKAHRDRLGTETEAPEKAPQKPAQELPPSEEGQALMLRTEMEDEKQILAELQGDFQAEVLKQYFYSFKDSKNRTVVGLSYKGVKQIALRQGHIEMKDLEIRESKEGITAIVKARHKPKDIEIYGVAWQPREAYGREDPFALTKAVSKAQRNALRGMISEAIVTEAYRAWLERREEWFGGEK